jgi:hypothetical protein
MYPPPARSIIVNTIMSTGSTTIGSEFCPLIGDVVGVEAIVCCIVVLGWVICVEGIIVGTVVRDTEFAPTAYRFLSSLPK